MDVEGRQRLPADDHLPGAGQCLEQVEQRLRTLQQHVAGAADDVGRKRMK